MKKIIISAMMLCSMGIAASAQQFLMAGAKDERTEKMNPRMSEFYAPQPATVTPGTNNSAPSDAVILFDGKDLSAWTSTRNQGEPAGWQVNGDGTFTVVKKAGDIQTKQSFKDFQLHIEWCVPEGIHGSGQGRGNSGIFLQSMYELQVLDCYENETYVNGMAGSIYKQQAPLVNPCRPNGQWNVYDVIYTAPTFKEDGTYRTRPMVTVIFNGVLVQYNTEILGVTEYIGFPQVTAHGDGPIRLQSHGDPSEPISYRNIWIRNL